MLNKKDLKKRLPLIVTSIMLVISFLITVRAVGNTVLLFKAHATGEFNSIFLLGDPLHPSLWFFFPMVGLLVYMWLVSTRIKFFQSYHWRLVQFVTMIAAILFSFIWIITADAYSNLVPYFEQRAEMIQGDSALQDVLIGNTKQFLLLVMTLPIIAIVLLGLYLGGLFNKYQSEIVEAFKKYEFKSKWIQKLTKAEKETGLPDVTLGLDSDTGEIVSVPGGDRTLNSAIIGSIGTGKSASQGLPLINQDLNHFVKYINDYPIISKRADYYDVKANYLNGIVVIEPSNDLCKDVYQLCLAHGIPKEMIYYVDPTNEDTPSINPLQGPVDKVAESLAMVIEGLGENDNFFFEQSQRSHLKQYVYLLKLHRDNDEPTLAELYQMYNDVQLVHQMHMMLKKRIEKYAPLARTETEKDFWDVVKDTDRWFDTNVVPLQDRNGENVIIKEGKYRKQIEYYDKKAEFIEGLKNILSDISSSLLLRRVLFKKSSFDMDAHLKAGGILLVNTENGSLMELSKVLGKMVLLSVQNAVFRREPRKDPFHSIYVDEFPEYIYKPFSGFPSQSRKYKAIIHVIAQTIAQLADDYGEYYMHTLLTTFRNKMVFADVSEYDAKTFSFLFHEKNNYKESTTEQSVSPLQESPVSRQGSSFSQEKEAVLTPSDILSLKAFEVAAKIVVNNESKPARRIKANFVPKEEFTEASIVVDPEAARIWLEDRNRLIEEMRNGKEQTLETIETVDQQEDRLKEEEKELEREIIESSLQTKHKALPEGQVRYPSSKVVRVNHDVKDEEVVQVIQAKLTKNALSELPEVPAIVEETKTKESSPEETSEKTPAKIETIENHVPSIKEKDALLDGTEFLFAEVGATKDDTPHETNSEKPNGERETVKVSEIGEKEKEFADSLIESLFEEQDK